MKRVGVFLGMLAGLGLALLASAWAQQQPGQANQGMTASQSSQGRESTTSNQAATLSALRGVLVSTETLLGSSIKNLEGEDLGEVRQLMVDPHTGRVTYAVVAMGGFLGMGEKTLVVPWRAVEFTHNGSSVVLSVPRHLLQEAPNDEQSLGSELADYSKQGSGGWGVETPYGRLYDPAKEQTISGQVTSIQPGAPLPGMTPGLQMVLQTDDAKTMRIHLGPVWYLAHQDIQLKENARGQITGATAEVEGQPVLMAREVQGDGYVLTLRNAEGQPMWSSLLRSTQ